MANCCLLRLLNNYKSEKVLNKIQCILDKLNKVYGKNIKIDDLSDSDKFELCLQETKRSQGNNIFTYGIAIAMFTIVIALFQIYLNNNNVVRLDIMGILLLVVFPIAFLSIVCFGLLYILSKPNRVNQNIDFICYIIEKYYHEKCT